jgi:PTS system nitrogen regulatory IIA component
MKLSDVLAGDRVKVDVSVTSKKRGLEEIARLLATGTELSEAEIFQSLTGREKLGSTGLGRGVAIPHGRLAGIEEAVGAFIRLRHAVDYEAHDGQNIDLAFGLVVPQSATEAHLKLLAAIAEKFSDDAFCKQLRECRSDAEAYKLLTD